jgi:flagellar biosynthetic protein FliQ
MTTEGAMDAMRNALLIVAQLAGPPLLAALVVGLVIGILQTIMQVTEASISFVFKLLAVCAVFTALGSHILTSGVEYTRRTIGSISEIVR